MLLLLPPLLPLLLLLLLLLLPLLPPLLLPLLLLPLLLLPLLLPLLLVGGGWLSIHSLQRHPGSSPHTDLRSTGMLSLLQMLYFLDNHFEVADDIFSQSQDTQFGFPFMVVGVRMTLLCMQAIRQVRTAWTAPTLCTHAFCTSTCY